MPIYFVTNRNLLKRGTDYGRAFSTAGLHDLRFGTLDGRVRTFPESPRRPGSREFYRRLHADMEAGADTLVYVHGYNTSFRDAVEAARAIHDRYTARPLAVVLFSWPSDGSMMPWVAYQRDRRDAETAGPAFGRAFLKTRDFLASIPRRRRCDHKIHLMAHSMGNHVLQFALRDIVELQPTGLPRLFDQVVLAAADVDSNAFDRDYKLGRLPEICSRVTVYCNRGDLALAMSDLTKGNPERLGHDGPAHPHTLPAKVVAVDAGDVAGADHSYHLENETVRRDIEETLAGRDPAQIARRRYAPHSNRYVLRR